MTDLDSKAETARSVIRATECEAQWFRLESRDLTPAEDIGGRDDFPQYGDFLDVTATDMNGEPFGPRWVECPGDLARKLVDLEVETGDRFQVTEATKTEDGAWSFEVQTDA